MAEELENEDSRTIEYLTNLIVRVLLEKLPSNEKVAYAAVVRSGSQEELSNATMLYLEQYLPIMLPIIQREISQVIEKNS